MSDLDQEEVKAIYELSKLTNITRQIMDDFSSTAILEIFKSYILASENPEEELGIFMEGWKENIIWRKKEELTTMIEQQDSMYDMVIGQKMVELEDLEEYVSEVDFVKEVITDSVINSIKD